MSETPAADPPPNPGPHRPPSRFARWGRRVKATAAALALYAALAAAVMAPLSSPALPHSGAADVANHVSGVIEARNALAEGQFPVRVAPHQNDGSRYPIFQFYGNLPYTAGGLLCLAARAGPYHAWKLVITAALVLGGFFSYAAARRLTRQGFPSAAAGAVFMTAPYLLADIHGRFAFPETVSFCLLPLVFWSLLRSFYSPRLGRVLVSGVAWAALALSHNITYLYGALFFALFFLSFFRPTWKHLGRAARLGAGFALGLLLTAWYVAPQLALLPHLSAQAADVWGNSWLTPLGVLLAPTVTPPVLLPTPLIDKPAHFGLQVGWPILAAVGAAVYALAAPSPLPLCPGGRGKGVRRWRRATLTRLVLAFGLAFVLAWSPFDFWRFLPSLLHFVQFSYRLLMFVVLWGALLAAYALSLLFKAKMTGPQLAACVAALGVFAAPSLGPHTACQCTSVEQEAAHPEMGRGGANGLYLPAPACLGRTTFLHRDVNYADILSAGVLSTAGERVEGVLPAPQAGDVLWLEGAAMDVGPGPVHLRVALDGAPFAAADLPPGPFRLSFPVASSFPGDRIQVVLLTDCLYRLAAPPAKARAAVLVSSLTLEPPPDGRDDDPPLITAAAAGCPTTFMAHADRPALVRAPVLYYPGLLRVKIDGRPVMYRNLGRFVAVAVGPGDHAISARFVGLPWANALSLLGWVAVLAGMCLPAARRLWHPATAFVCGWFALFAGLCFANDRRDSGASGASQPAAPHLPRKERAA
jgi:hypothetical protein